MTEGVEGGATFGAKLDALCQPDCMCAPILEQSRSTPSESRKSKQVNRQLSSMVVKPKTNRRIYLENHSLLPPLIILQVPLPFHDLEIRSLGREHPQISILSSGKY